MCSPTAACDQPPPDDICEVLRRVIEELIERVRPRPRDGTKGLRHRFREQIEGRNGPGTTGWNNHDQEIRRQQRTLKTRLEEWQQNRCGPPPPGAWHWATRPRPQPREWRGPPVSAREVAEVAAGGAAALGLGYLIYRGVRMMPSLLPPLWPTIPVNLAVP